MEFDPTAERGWRNALKRVTMRHLATRAVTSTETGAVTSGSEVGQASVTGALASARATKVVAGAVAAEGELREDEEEVDLVEALAWGKRDLFPEQVFDVEFDEPASYAGVEDEAELVAV